jgi:hypothetical protein
MSSLKKILFKKLGIQVCGKKINPSYAIKIFFSSIFLNLIGLTGGPHCHLIVFSTCAANLALTNGPYWLDLLLIHC